MIHFAAGAPIYMPRIRLPAGVEIEILSGNFHLSLSGEVVSSCRETTCFLSSCKWQLVGHASEHLLVVFVFATACVWVYD